MITAFAILAAVASLAETRKQGQARNIKLEMAFGLAKLQLKNATVVDGDEYEVFQIESLSKDLHSRLFENEAENETEKEKCESDPFGASCLYTAGSATAMSDMRASFDADLSNPALLLLLLHPAASTLLMAAPTTATNDVCDFFADDQLSVSCTTRPAASTLLPAALGSAMNVHDFFAAEEGASCFSVCPSTRPAASTPPTAASAGAIEPSSMHGVESKCTDHVTTPIIVACSDATPKLPAVISPHVGNLTITATDGSTSTVESIQNDDGTTVSVSAGGNTVRMTAADGSSTTMHVDRNATQLAAGGVHLGLRSVAFSDVATTREAVTQASTNAPERLLKIESVDNREPSSLPGVKSEYTDYEPADCIILAALTTTNEMSIRASKCLLKSKSIEIEPSSVHGVESEYTDHVVASPPAGADATLVVRSSTSSSSSSSSSSASASSLAAMSSTASYLLPNPAHLGDPSVAVPMFLSYRRAGQRPLRKVGFLFVSLNHARFSVNHTCLAFATDTQHILYSVLRFLGRTRCRCGGGAAQDGGETRGSAAGCEKQETKERGGGDGTRRGCGG
jgi:hypothetical protein